VQIGEIDAECIVIVKRYNAAYSTETVLAGALFCAVLLP
jgi:hypothetical protein